MGYYTTYTMSFYADIETVRQIRKSFSKMELYENVFCFEKPYYDEKTNYYEHTSDFVKWYECSDDMLKVSKEFPNITFRVEGIGEDNDDRWYSLYKDGYEDYCAGKFVFDEPKKLKWENHLQ